MSTNITSQGYLGQDPKLNAQDLASFNSIYNSSGNSDDPSNAKAIQELASSKDQISHDFGQLFQSGTYNAEAMHDVIWALNQDQNTKTDSANVQDAVTRTFNDPNLSASDANHS